MARKPRSEWTPAYRRRVEAAEAKGKTGPALRGHKPREHVERKRREVAKRGYTPGQASQITKFARQQAARSNGDPVDAARVLREWVARHGYDRFRELRDRINGHHKQRKLERKRITVTTAGVGGGAGGRVTIHASTSSVSLPDLYDEFDLWEFEMPDGDEFGWGYYG